jgi:hypothetical protein
MNPLDRLNASFSGTGTSNRRGDISAMLQLCSTLISAIRALHPMAVAYAT